MKFSLKAIIGLGNPGAKFVNTRHNIGFQIADYCVEQLNGSWQHKDLADIATINWHGQDIIVVKPQTFMNDSGKVLSLLTKKGIQPQELLVIHDELELPFGRLKLKYGGSAKGHNGLRSIMEVIGQDFHRLACGIDRPAQRELVGEYVLSNFNKAEQTQLPTILHNSFTILNEALK